MNCLRFQDFLMFFKKKDQILIFKFSKCFDRFIKVLRAKVSGEYMNVKYFLTIFLISAFLFGCDYDGSWRDRPYVVWIQESNERVLNRVFEDESGGKEMIRRVKAEIIAVGSNDLYVVAKRKDPASKVIYYYYIEKSKDGKYLNLDEITQGPFNKDEFIKLKKELGLPAFSKKFNPYNPD